MEPQIIDHYNELPSGINVIDKMNEEFDELQQKYDNLEKEYNDMKSKYNKLVVRLGRRPTMAPNPELKKLGKHHHPMPIINPDPRIENIRRLRRSVRASHS